MKQPNALTPMINLHRRKPGWTTATSDGVRETGATEVHGLAWLSEDFIQGRPTSWKTAVKQH